MAFTRLDLESKIKEFFDLEAISPTINTQITKLVRERQLCISRHSPRSLFLAFRAK